MGFNQIYHIDIMGMIHDQLTENQRYQRLNTIISLVL